MTDTGNTSVTVQLLRLPYEHCYFLKLLTHPPIKASWNLWKQFCQSGASQNISTLCCYFSITLSSLHGKKIILGI